MASMRLTVRDLLWLILVAAIGLAWYRSDQKRAEEVSEIRQLLADWKAGTADLQIRSGVAVRYIETLSADEMKTAPFFTNRRISPLSEPNRHFHDEIRSMGLELVDKPAPGVE